MLRMLIFPALLAGLLTATAVACGGEGGDNAGQPADDTTREISEADLSRMVLSQDQFGLEFEAFTAAEGNGPLTVDSAAAEEYDPAAERARLENAGFSTGREAFFSDSQAVARQNGLFQIGTSVGLFSNSAGAAGYFRGKSANIAEDVGKTKGGVTLTKIERFDAELAGEGSGARLDARFVEELTEAEKKKRDPISFALWGAAISFRHGRLVGTVSVAGIAPSDAEKERLEGRVKDLARKLNEQIGVVLAVATPSGG